MSWTQNERQEARSALNTVINSSKRTTGFHLPLLLLAVPPLTRSSSHLQTTRVEGGGVRDGLSRVNLQGASMEGGWRAGGQLCCLLGLSPCWAVIKSRPWCEAFCWGQQSASTPAELGCIPERICHLFSEFIVIVVPSHNSIFLPTMSQIHLKFCYCWVWRASLIYFT